MDFNLVNLAITVQTVDGDSLLKWLHRFGSELSEVCRSRVCRWPARACEFCSSREMCAWHLVFSQKLTVDPSALKRHQKPPLPFIFSFPNLNEPCNKKDQLECGLIVIGSAIPHLEMLLEGFSELMAGDNCPVPARIVQVGSRDYQGALHALGIGTSITRPEEVAVLSAEGLLNIRPWDYRAIEIRLLSPLRFIEAGRPLKIFDFSRFARSVLRRVSSLAYYYGEHEFDCDFKLLSIQANAVNCVADYFGFETGGSWKINGITGHGKFNGDFSGLMPFLVLGMYMHVGKGAAFGMGHYELIFEDMMNDT